jgi:hypothetical protein
MKVAVLDPSLIPNLVDVVIGDFVYELQFRVEDGMTDGEVEVIDMDSTMEDDDPTKEKQNEDKTNENMDIDGKKIEEHAPNNAAGSQLPAVGGAAQQVLEVHQTQPLQPNKKPVLVLAQNEMLPSGDGQWKANLMKAKNDSGLLSKIKMQNGETVSPRRLSKRNAANIEMDSTEKAARLKAKKNLVSIIGKGKFQEPTSFVNRDDSSLISATKSLGLVLGNNDQNAFNALKSLKDQEFLRLAENSKLRDENFVSVEDASTGCSNDDSVVFEALNLFCSDIAEGLGDGGCDPLSLQTPISQVKRGHPNCKTKKK